MGILFSFPFVHFSMHLRDHPDHTLKTTKGHILIFDLVESDTPLEVASELFSLRTSRINIDVPHILHSFPPAAGQGEVYDTSPSSLMKSTNIPELRFRTGGIMRFRNQIIGHAHLGGHGTTAQRGLFVALEHIRSLSHTTTDFISRGGFLKIPHKVPPKVVWKGSGTQAVPEDWLWVDDDGEEQVDIEKWSWEDVGVRLLGEESTYLTNSAIFCLADVILLKPSCSFVPPRCRRFFP
jgi:hypothetical protein